MQTIVNEYGALFMGWLWITAEARGVPQWSPVRDGGIERAVIFPDGQAEHVARAIRGFEPCAVRTWHLVEFAEASQPGDAAAISDIKYLLEAYRYGQFADDMFDHPSASCRSPCKPLREALRRHLSWLEKQAAIVKQLHAFLNAAAGEGFVLDGVDAADLYVAVFPERYAATIASIDGAGS